jgi:hypothetical protein
MAEINPKDSVNAAQIQLLIGIAANQGGTLVTGYSATANTTDSYNVTTTINDGLNNGITLGYGGVSQIFAANDPSFLPGVGTIAGSGTVGSNPLGLFMATFASAGTTTLAMTAATHSLSQVDEVVLRTANSVQPMTNGGTLVTCPHVTYNGTMYTDENQSLAVNGQGGQFGYMQFILFAPASKIGANESYFVSGTYTVIDPVTNDTNGGPTGNLNRTDPSTWVAKDPIAWINDPGCAGLLTAINSMAGTSDQTNANWKALVSYWQAYFIKFYAGLSTMFNNNSGPHGEGWLGSGSQASASFEIIALDDSKGPLQTNGNSSLGLIWDAGNTTYTLNNSVMNVVGQPPIMFTTTVSNTAS